ncbi:MAG: MoxR family ATPase [Acidimicrobiales bacterium]|nr:MoxR family ATPase [Acidimicrobiales bacterium]
MSDHPQMPPPDQIPSDRVSMDPVSMDPASMDPEAMSQDRVAPTMPLSSPPADAPSPAAIPQAPQSQRQRMGAIRDEVNKVIVGQGGVLSGLLCAFLASGHVLLEGVPGTAKTALVKSLAAAVSLEAARVQFTPDLMPSDVLGQMVFENGSFRFREGPVFTNLLLADEINRTPPKTQAALLEAMEERQVSIDGVPRLLPKPFMVIATQNPVEYEGTYPLPEAQLDRFLLKLIVDYPSEEDEFNILVRHHSGMDPHDPIGSGIRAVATAGSFAAAQGEVQAMTVEDPVLRYIVALVRATRSSPSLQLGVSPRGATALLAVSKAWAWLSGQPYVTPDEVKAMAKPTLRHRIQLRPELEIEGVTTDLVLDGILSQVHVQ